MIGILGGGVTSVVAAFMVLAAIVVLLTSSGNLSDVLQECAPAETAGGSGVVQASLSTGSIPRNYLDLYQQAGKEWNVPWNVLAGIGYVESRHGTSNEQGVHSGENFKGAGGPMQFLKSTFDGVALDGDGDGTKSRYDPADAIFSAAKLLKVHILGTGASARRLKARTLTAAEIRKSVYSYNHSWDYVNDVLAQANRYSAGYKVAPANAADTAACSAALTLGSGSFGQRIADAAAYWAKKDPGTPRPPRQNTKATPYSWGGGSLSGPSLGIEQGASTVGFDCSGLARYAVYQASNKKITMPRTAAAMWHSGKGTKVSRDRLAPGDLVFFENLAHMGIYYGEVNGVHWMVEAPHTGAYVRFSRFDGRSDYVGALRVTPPSGMDGASPSVIHAMAPAGVGVPAGAM